MTEILILNRAEVEALLTLETIVPVMEQAFIGFADGSTKAFPVVREAVTEHRGIFGIKSGYLTQEGVIGLKAGGFWLGNPDRGLTAHQSTTVMFDPATGVPTAVMDGNHITTIRTAAVGALAARVLAREDARVAAVLGCGTQGTGQAEALCHVRDIQEIRAYDVNPDAVQRFQARLQALGVTVRPVETAEEAVRGVDVVVTATPGHGPVLEDAWVEPGMHVSAFGTDTVGKAEIQAELFARATVVVDDVAQATTIGETQHAVARGLLAPDAIHATLGEILAGRRPGRTRADEITLLDSTGLAFQDLVSGHLAARLAEERGLGTRVRLS